MHQTPSTPDHTRAPNIRTWTTPSQPWKEDSVTYTTPSYGLAYASPSPPGTQPAQPTSPSQPLSQRATRSQAVNLPLYRSLPNTREGRAVASGLMGFQALLADQQRMRRDASGGHHLDWAWYIKDLTKRQVMNAITPLVIAIY
ncbi:hypothetical protein FRB90_007157 [Tulasnella sp. 427]|nr:hypothetical protein FRB90_007157 [Tulasnella sp. 427]